MDTNAILNTPFFTGNYLTLAFWTDKVNAFLAWFHATHIGSVIYIVAYILSLFGLTMIIYCFVRMIEIAYEEDEHLKHAIHDFHDRHNEATDPNRNPRWEHIQELLGSPHSNEWRLAIIEADSVLESLLIARDIPGNGIGERLKNMSPGDLGSIQAAWEAHLVRNRIAHEGTEFELSARDARRAIQLYEVVFRELGFL